jgi:hypothetical protein
MFIAKHACTKSFKLWKGIEGEKNGEKTYELWIITPYTKVGFTNEN